VTFGGHRFHLPFLTTRSVFLGVPLGRSLEKHRWSTDYHVDLLDVLTHHGAMAPAPLRDYIAGLGESFMEVDMTLSPLSQAYAEAVAQKSIAVGFLFSRVHEVLSPSGQIA
jgi:hypothetical protein